MPVLMSLATAAAIWSILSLIAWRIAERRLDEDPLDDHIQAAATFWAFCWVAALVVAFVLAYINGWFGILVAR